MKHILLLGATGKTGIEVLEYALSRGHRVTVLVRDPDKVSIRSDRLAIVMGSPLDGKDLRAINTIEAVISTLGHSNLDPSAFMTNSIRNVVMVMKDKGIRRIVVQTGAGAGDSFARMPPSVQNVIRDTGLKNIYDDHHGQEQVVMNAGLDWTVVRPVTLSDGEQGMPVVMHGPISESLSISRKTVAKFLVDCLETNEHIGKAVVISEEK